MVGEPVCKVYQKNRLMSTGQETRTCIYTQVMQARGGSSATESKRSAEESATRRRRIRASFGPAAFLETTTNAFFSTSRFPSFGSTPPRKARPPAPCRSGGPDRGAPSPSGPLWLGPGRAVAAQPEDALEFQRVVPFFRLVTHQSARNPNISGSEAPSESWCPQAAHIHRPRPVNQPSVRGATPSSTGPAATESSRGSRDALHR
jgi:hypothetical protein